MSEQQGQAAGTAKPETPSAVNLFKPWRIDTQHNVVVDANGDVVAICVNNRGQDERTNPITAAEMARHIVACVNFCCDLNTEMLECFGTGQYKIHVSRVSLNPEDGTGVVYIDATSAPVPERLVPRLVPIARDEFSGILSAGHASFTRDLRDGNASLDGPLPGGAL